MIMFVEELRGALRSCRRRPRFATAVVLLLGLGISGAVLVFSLVNGIVLQPLPYPEPERLVELWDRWDDNPQGLLTAPEFLAVRDDTRSFAALGAFVTDPISLTEGEPEVIQALAASAQLFEVLGVETALGRVFTAEEDQPGAELVVLLTYEFWKRRYGGDESMLGRTLRFEEDLYEVIGVLAPGTRMPRTYRGDPRSDVWIPLKLEPAFNVHYFSVLGRLAPDTQLATAQAELDLVVERIRSIARQRDPASLPSFGMTAYPLLGQVLGRASETLFLGLGAVSLILILTCANIAHVLLARAEGRRREFGIRAALGASRQRLAAQLLMESLLLAVLGGACALALSVGGLSLIRRLGPVSLPRLAEVGVDWRVLVFTLVLSALTGIAVGAFPALRLSGQKLESWLRGSATARNGGHSHSTTGLLVMSEVAVALAVLIPAGLLALSQWHLERVDLGFETRHLLTFNLSLPHSSYRQRAESSRFYRELHHRLEALPSIESAGAARILPLISLRSGLRARGLSGVEIEGIAPPNTEAPVKRVAVTPGYFEAMGMPVLRGRAITDLDDIAAPRVAVINEALADLYFSGVNPVGHRLRSSRRGRVGPNASNIDRHAWSTVVGVIRNSRDEPRTAARPTVYNSHSQRGQSANMFVVVRSALRDDDLLREVRAVIADIDPDLPMARAQSMAAVRSGVMAGSRFATSIMLVSAGIGFVLALVGCSAVISHSVAGRRREIGVRLALGAQSRQIANHIAFGVLRWAAGGVLLGLGASWALSSTVAPLLFNVPMLDYRTFAAATALLAAGILGALYSSIREATAMDVTEALRSE